MNLNTQDEELVTTKRLLVDMRADRDRIRKEYECLFHEVICELHKAHCLLQLAHSYITPTTIAGDLRDTVAVFLASKRKAPYLLP